MSSVSLAIIARDNNDRSELAGIIGTLGDNVGVLSSSSDFEEGIVKIRESTPHIVILDVREVGQGVRETSAIVSQFPKTSVFVTCDQKNPDWILSLLRAGAGEYLTKPINAAELVDAVKKVAKFHWQAKKKGGAVSTYNPIGGMGATTVAVNLAAALSAQGEGAGLIDLNILSPDVSTFLDLSSRYNLATVASKRGEIDGSFLKSVMVRHNSGIEVLAGSADRAGPKRLQPEKVESLLFVSRDIFTHTVVDTCGELAGCNLAAFEQSDFILYTVVLNLPALKNARWFLAEMKSQFGPNKVRLVVNRYSSKDEISLAAAEKVLGMKVYACLPNAYSDMQNAINRGEPSLRCYPKSQFSKAMFGLAGRLLQEVEESQQIALQKGG
jgi:pilus assembly protein CpaE